MSNEFRYGEERQVQVSVKDHGGNYLPVMPYCGTAVDHWRAPEPIKHAVTRIENGTIIRFLAPFHVDVGDPLWIFCLSTNIEIQFLVPSSFQSALWKFKMKSVTKLR